MKLSTIACIGLICFAPLLPAETVMIAVSASSPPSGEKDGKTDGAFLLSALEDGIMDEFFQAGHIAFNVQIFTGGNQDPTAMIRSAREGGASRLLAVGVAFAGGGSPDFEKVDYSLVSVADRRTVSSGSVKAAELPRRPEEPRDEFFAEAGRAVARKALSKRK